MPFWARPLRTPSGSSLNATSSGMPVSVTSQSARADVGDDQIEAMIARRPMARRIGAPQTGLRPPARLLEDLRLAPSPGEFRLPIMMLSPPAFQSQSDRVLLCYNVCCLERPRQCASLPPSLAALLSS